MPLYSWLISDTRFYSKHLPNLPYRLTVTWSVAFSSSAYLVLSLVFSWAFGGRPRLVGSAAGTGLTDLRSICVSSIRSATLAALVDEFDVSWVNSAIVGIVWDPVSDLVISVMRRCRSSTLFGSVEAPVEVESPMLRDKSEPVSDRPSDLESARFGITPDSKRTPGTSPWPLEPPIANLDNRWSRLLLLRLLLAAWESLRVEASMLVFVESWWACDGADCVAGRAWASAIRGKSFSPFLRRLHHISWQSWSFGSLQKWKHLGFIKLTQQTQL